MASLSELIRGKRSLLLDTLDVSTAFLSKLQDKDVITKHHVETIKSFKTSSSRVDALLEILVRRDDRRVQNFISALKNTGQSHIIDSLKLPADKYPQVDNESLRKRPGERPEDSSSPSGIVTEVKPKGHSQRIFTTAFANTAAVILGLCFAGFFSPTNSAKEDVNRVTGNSRAPPGGSFRTMFQGHRSQLGDNIDPNEMWSALQDRNLLTARQIEDCKGEKTTSDKVSRMLEFLEKKEDSLVPKYCEALVQTGNTKVIKDHLKECRNYLEIQA